MTRENVIAILLALSFLLSMSAATASANNLQQKLDSLFVIASSGEVRFRDMVEPAKDSIAAMGAEVVPLLIDKFITKSARERWTILEILKKIGTPAVPYLVEALRRPDGLVVQRVCWALGDIGDSSSTLPLIAVCNHGRWQVREQAVGALGKTGDDRAAEAVLLALDDPIGQVRKAAAVSCGKLVVEHSIDKLAHLLGDGFYGARMSAVESILKMDTVRVIRTLTDSIDSENELVGDLACYVLGEYGTEEALELLMLQTYSLDPDRRAHASVAIIRGDPTDYCGFHQFLFEHELDRLVLLKMKSALSPRPDEN